MIKLKVQNCVKKSSVKTMELSEEWTVIGTLDELPDQTLDDLILRPRHIFPLPEKPKRSYADLMPDTVQSIYHELMVQRQQRDQMAACAEAFKYLNQSKINEEKEYMNDDERRKAKTIERLREKLKSK